MRDDSVFNCRHATAFAAVGRGVGKGASRAVPTSRPSKNACGYGS